MSTRLPQLLGELTARWRTVRYWVREYFGENEYARYVAAWQARHAGMDGDGEHRMMTAREFFDHRLAVKYGGVIQRC